jgi:nicotinate-nucleotide adenylyltransferase
MRKSIGIFGGTFDPIHIGHLRLALELKEHLRLDEMRLLPCYIPTHRTSPAASSQQRVDMLQIALENSSDLTLDLRDIKRDKPTYTYDTLCELRDELGGQVSISVCMGMDSYVTLDTWHHWQELIQLAHLVVTARPGWKLPSEGLIAELTQAHSASIEQIHQSPAGVLAIVSQRLLPISASEIRFLIEQKKSPQFLLPDAVWQYIKKHRLYQ